MGTNKAKQWLEPPAGVLRVAFLYVGQGESTLMMIPRSEGGHLSVLVDCNRADKLGGIDLARMLQDLLPKASGDDRVDLGLFWNTHPHTDHLGGLAELRKAVKVGGIWHSGHNPGKEHGGAYEELKALIREVQKRDGSIVELLGSRSAEDLGLATVNVVSPAQHVCDDIDDEDPADRYKRIHEQCAVLRVSYGSSTKKIGVLITGDSDRTAWEDHITGYHGGNEGQENRIAAEILSASHHGSITFFKDRDDDDQDAYEDHLASIQPQYVVISAPDAKDSPHDHPHPEAVEHYKKWVAKRSGEVLHMGSRGWSLIADIRADGTFELRWDKGELREAYRVGDEAKKNDGDEVNKGPAIVVSRVERSRPMGSR